MKFLNCVLLIILTTIGTNLVAQNKGGDNCGSATSLGLPGGPETCPNGTGFKGENTDLATVALKNPSCDQVGSNYDLWYSFTAPMSGIIQLNIKLGTAIRIEAAVYADCNTEVFCLESNAHEAMIMNLIPGNIYFLQLWSDGFAKGTFDFCIFEKEGPPENNNCNSPHPLQIVIGSDPCSMNSTGELLSNIGATASGETPLPSCGNFGAGKDVWYTFAVPQSGSVNIEMTEALGPQDWAMSVYNGSCGNLIEIQCDDDDGSDLKPLIELIGRTPGENLLIRVWEIGGDDFGSFRLSVSETNNLLPDNNICDVAIDLTSSLSTTGICNSICGHNMNATPSGSSPFPNCSKFGVGNDVWYKATVPADGGFNIEMSAFSTQGPQDWSMAVYTGLCDNLTQLKCDDDSGPGLYPYVTLYGLVPGTEVFIRVWEFESNEEGPFDICLTPQSPLAIDGLNLEASAMEFANMISWNLERTSSWEEMNLMTSLDGKNWALINPIDLENISLFSYYMHENPSFVQFYKMEIVKQNGISDQSNVIVVERNYVSKSEMKISPVPAYDQMNIEWSQLHPGKNVSFQVIDLNGRYINIDNLDISIEVGAAQLSVDVLTPGAYMIKVAVEGVSKSMMFTKI